LLKAVARLGVEAIALAEVLEPHRELRSPRPRRTLHIMAKDQWLHVAFVSGV
jgi:hypothetical protein